jgi:hypothetical protein
MHWGRRIRETREWAGEIEVQYGLHPAAVLQGRSSDKRGLFKEQVKEAVDTAQGKIYHRPGVVPEAWEMTDDIERICYPAGRWLSMDTETDTLEDGIGNIRVGWSVSDSTRAGFSQSDPTPFLSHIPHVYLHNAAYDIPQLGMDPWEGEAWDDTMLMVYVLRLWERVGLKECGPKITGIPMESITSILGSGKASISFSEALKRSEEGEVLRIERRPGYDPG